MELRIPVPPLSEQRLIAEMLDQADEMRAKRRQAIALFDDLAKSIFFDMFGDRQSIFRRWPINSLEKLLDFLTSGSRGWAKYYIDPPWR